MTHKREKWSQSGLNSKDWKQQNKISIEITPFEIIQSFILAKLILINDLKVNSCFYSKNIRKIK